ncbi:hypothetical protein H2198_007968 [Neophaeococcomyces mojaviensis]|uniref:Uncharacterized protein n=1 Tax=Neophaeococcomyces mojaviensis TaxID=3383035 RepID=A0ACC2ZYP7_9EURO|nr:hypothetical protein H2198_007968 [Knufia sp. JES_112]
MATRSAEASPYLKRPLYIYDLPPELIETLTLHTTTVQQRNQEVDTQPAEGSLQRITNEDGVSTSTACTLCRSTFQDVSDQRQHVRSDFHRYNLKLQMKQLPPIDETTFIKNIGDLDESISGSESSESDSDDDNSQSRDTTLTALLKKQARISQNDEENHVTTIRKRGPGNAPMYWLTSPKLPDGMGLGIYRAILSNDEQDAAQSSITDILKRKQLQPIHAKHSGNTQSDKSKFADPHFFLCMIGGGRFAAAVIGLAPEIRKGHGGVEERHAVVKAHKTFHRYTTRRKQGGSQSANDNAKGNAHSVGSSIRRANEAALVVDIRNLLAEWKSMIDSAELIFVRATGSQNRHTIFGPYEGQVLTSKDKRLRGYPFSTRRATQNELVRAFQELTRAKVDKLIEEEPEKPNEQTQQKAQQKPKPALAKATPEQEEALLHTSQLQNLIRRSKAPGILLYLKKNNISANFPFYPSDQGSNHHAPTPLHLAASSNAVAVVTALLTKADADPTITNAEGKTPCDIAGNSKTHDAFRVARHVLGENTFDWSKAHVPSPLSPEEAEAKAKREQTEATTAEAERRKADLEKISQEEEERKVGKIEKKAGTGKTLNGAPPEKSWVDKQEEQTRGMTPEMRMRLERERRARAAEARMNAMNGNR